VIYTGDPVLCQGRENKEVMVNTDSGYKKCIKHFGGETFWTATTQKTKQEKEVKQ
jgi:hypothetical protein